MVATSNGLSHLSHSHPLHPHTAQDSPVPIKPLAACLFLDDQPYSEWVAKALNMEGDISLTTSILHYRYLTNQIQERADTLHTLQRHLRNSQEAL